MNEEEYKQENYKDILDRVKKTRFLEKCHKKKKPDFQHLKYLADHKHIDYIKNYVYKLSTIELKYLAGRMGVKYSQCSNNQEIINNILGYDATKYTDLGYKTIYHFKHNNNKTSMTEDPELPINILKKYPEDFDWSMLSMNTKYTNDHRFIRRFRKYINKDKLIITDYSKFTYDFMCKYFYVIEKVPNALNNFLYQNQDPEITTEFLDLFCDKIDWEIIKKRNLLFKDQKKIFAEYLK